MGERVEWLKLQMRHGRPERLPLLLTVLLGFEAFYQWCALRGYRPRHVFADPPPAGLRTLPPGAERALLIWPRLPLSIRVLERLCPYANGSHAEYAPYSPEALSEARASGRRAEVVEVRRGEIRAGGSFK